MFSANFINAVANGNAYSWTNVDYDYDAADTILWVANTGTGGKNLFIERVDVSSDTATVYTIHLPTYTAPAGTVVTETNLSANSTNAATDSAYADETNNTQGNKVAGGHLMASDTKTVDVSVKLGYNKCIAVDLVDAGTGAVVTIWGYFA